MGLSALPRIRAPHRFAAGNRNAGGLLRASGLQKWNSWSFSAVSFGLPALAIPWNSPCCDILQGPLDTPFLAAHRTWCQRIGNSRNSRRSMATPRSFVAPLAHVDNSSVPEFQAEIALLSVYETKTRDSVSERNEWMTRRLLMLWLVLPWGPFG